MPSSQPRQRFVDIIDNIDAIRRHTAGMTQDQFNDDEKTIDATERCLTRISEAPSKLGLLAEELAPNQPWRDIRGLGNWLQHDYPAMDGDTIWKTVSNDLASLRADCQAAAQELGRRQSRQAP